MGVCGCHGYDLTQGDDYKEVMKTMIHFEDMLGDLDGETIRKVVELFCNGVIGYGDNGQVRTSNPCVNACFSMAFLTSPNTTRLYSNATIIPA